MRDECLLEFYHYQYIEADLILSMVDLIILHIFKNVMYILSPMITVSYKCCHISKEYG